VAVVGLNIARGPDIQDPEASDHELGIIMRDTAAAVVCSLEILVVVYVLV